MKPMRVACLFIPLFPLVSRLRQEPELTGAPLVIHEGSGPQARVMAAARAARRFGIKPGLSLPQAKAILPDLIARGRDLVGERSAQAVLFEVAEMFSPRVEEGGDGLVFLDVGGAERGRVPERELGQLLSLATARVALPARVGVAASKLAARVAARQPDSPTIVPHGEEACFLAPLPIVELELTPKVAATLECWGIRAIGEFARLPLNEVVSRLGEVGRRLHAAARGVDCEPLVARVIPETFAEGQSFEWQILSLDAFVFAAEPVLERLMQRLASAGLACRQLSLALELELSGHDVRAIEMPAPTRDVKTLVSLVRLSLETRPPVAAVCAFAFTARPDRPRSLQHSLFGPPALAPDKLATTVARLAARLGVDRVGAPQTIAGHRPERLVVARYDPPPPPEAHLVPRAARGFLAVRVLRPSVPLEVVATQDRSGRWHLRSVKSTGGLAIHGSVSTAAGPWACEEGWWSAEALLRDYWDIELGQGELYRIYRDQHSGLWFADGVYD